jgi:4a-hydroxytetrahydrobiopterin dehydratase
VPCWLTAWANSPQAALGEVVVTMPASLADRTCVPCKGGVPPLTAAQIAPLQTQLDDWTVKDDKRLERTYKVKNFAEAMAFANAVADIAEEQAHHPDLYVRWRAVNVDLRTHTIDGLTESDFYFAAKCDRAYQQHQSA